MASTTVSRQVGVVDFKVIHIDPMDIATAFQKFVDNGSKLTGVSLDDIDTDMVTVPADQTRVTLVELLTGGMKLFDAAVWLTAGKPTSHPLQQSLTMKESDIPGLQAVSKAVFYVFFFILTQARYPSSANEAQKPVVPNFLKVVMGLDKPQNEYIDLLCSFNAKTFDPKWVRFVKFNGLGQEALSRFGLGVAGYRLFAPFKVYPVKAGLPVNLIESAAFARSVAIANSSWDIHPTTRNASVLTKRGNLNKNLGNLILEVFTNEQIDEMVKSKMLYQKPVREPNYMNYMTWGSADDISGSARIFPA